MRCQSHLLLDDVHLILSKVEIGREEGAEVVEDRPLLVVGPGCEALAARADVYALHPGAMGREQQEELQRS